MLSPLSLPVNTLSVDLLPLLSKDQDKNVVISSLSISTAMSIAMMGARNETEKQIFNGLCFNKSFASSSLVHDQFTSLLNSPNFTDSSNNDLKLKMANYLLIQQDENSHVDKYKKEVADKYQARVDSVDFQVDGEEIKKNVNDWVAEKTNNKISSVMNDVPSPNTFAVLLNAVYFKGKWTEPFSKGATKELSFFNEGKEEVPVKFMRKNQEMFYVAFNVSFAGQKCTIISLPYRSKANMVVVLPIDRDGLKKMEGMKYEDLAINGLRSTLINLSFPKFKLECSESMISPLKSLGIVDVFNQTSDLSGINGKRNLFLSGVFHKTFIEVDEEGTEAAAVTGMMYGQSTSLQVREPIDIVVDHPFLFFIRDETSGIFLFSGAVNKL